ncbi:MAG: InlB B-repeat-containing protein, partial [Candidatus Izemoplasmataceae bacterium]
MKTFYLIIFTVFFSFIVSGCEEVTQDDDGLTVTVSFNVDGGSIIESIDVQKGSTIIAPSDPIKANHTFEGWYSDSSFDTVFDFSTAIEEETTLYAKWEAVQNNPDEATISFNSNGGTNHPAITQEVGTTLGNLPTPVKDGYTFQGWYTNSNLTNAFTQSTMPSTNTTLYAKWEAVQNNPDEATISFNSNGGTNHPAITQEVGTTLGNLPTPVKDG